MHAGAPSAASVPACERAQACPARGPKEGARATAPCPACPHPAGVSALACPAGLVPAGGAWGSPAAYRMTLLLTPAAALQRAWADTDSLFAGIRDWAAQPIALRRPFAL